MVVIDTDGEFPDDAEADTAAMMVWFGRRAGSVRELPVSWKSAVLGLQEALLRGLSLEMTATRHSATDFATGSAPECPEDLTIHMPHEGPALVFWGVRGALSIGILPRLPALTSMCFMQNDVPPLASQPTVCELAALRSSSLTEMDWPMASIRERSLAHGPLPALVSYHLRWESHAVHVMHTTTASFSGATGLTS